MEKELLVKYFRNRCTDQELETVFSWFRDTAGKKEGEELLKRLWEELPLNESLTETDMNSVLARIHHRINIEQTRILLEAAEDNLIKFRRRKHLIRFLRNAAAALLFPILGLGLFYSYNYYKVKSEQVSGMQAFNEVISSADAITKVTLPDGSRVWLNHSSSLRYPAAFTGKSRDVELKGEGYFEVTHDPGVPFIVNTGVIEVIARGTVFNVLAYPNENKVETSLISGNVELYKLSNDRKRTALCSMNPHDYAVYHIEENEIIVNTINDDRYFSWKDGKLIFTTEPLEDVTRKLSRWFNADIQIMDHELYDLTLTATFVHETLPQVMELLAISIPIRFEISNREKNTDGSFTRKKVLIYYR